MNQSCRVVPVLLGLLLLTVGCGSQPGEPILVDQFESPDGTWTERVGEASSQGYADGTYTFEIARPSWFVWTTSEKEYGDVRIAVDTRLASGPDDNHCGVICRQEAVGSFYYLAVSSDGYYGIFRRLDSGPLEAINSAGAMVYSPAIRTGGEAIHVEAICEGNRIALLANGELLETVTDDSLQKGHLGFGAGSGTTGPVRIQFDDLAVYAR